MFYVIIIISVSNMESFFFFSFAQDNDDSAEMKIPDYPLNKPVSVNGNNLKDFFYLACGEEERLNILQGQGNSKFINLQKINDPNNYGKDVVKPEMSKAQIDELRWGELDDLCHIKCTITYSGFNPPPSHRLLYGDLAYLEVLLPDTQTKIHVTATHIGFYINRSSFSKFDPKPTSDPCFSHTLLDCLLKYSTSLRCAWVRLDSLLSLICTLNLECRALIFLLLLKTSLKP